MKSKIIWIDLSLFNLVIVALLGVLLRSKILFCLPMINFPYLLNAHSHFAFGGWVTLTLLVLMVYYVLPVSVNRKPVYQWLFGGIVFTSYGMLLTFPFEGYGTFSTLFSTLFIFVTYAFSWIFINDIRKANVSKPVLLLSVSALLCLSLSSSGPFTLAYLFSIHSRNTIFYKDALFTYLHLQYNGFFTLAVFALLFHKLETKVIPIAIQAKKNIHRFSVLLCISILPALFLSFLWQDPDDVLRAIAIAGSILVFLSLTWFIIAALLLTKEFKLLSPLIRYLVLLSMSAFSLKMFLQMLTIFPEVGNKVFGDRMMIIGFLHLVFLAFVSLFLLAYFLQVNLLNSKNKFTQLALIIFSLSVVFNEIVLMAEGLGAMFLKHGHSATWLLWIVSIWLFAGAASVAFARIKYSTTFFKSGLGI